MQNLLYFFDSLIPNFGEVIGTVGIVILIFGIATSFFGYKLFNLVLSITGFLVGAAIGYIVFLNVGNDSIGSEAVVIYILAGGAIGSELAGIFHGLGVFLAVGSISVIVAFLATQDTRTSLVLGVICGIVGASFEKYIIFVTTALSGGVLSATGIWFIGISKGENKSVQAIGWIIGICGFVFQLWMGRRKTPEESIPITYPRIQSPVQGKVAQNPLLCPNCGFALAADAMFCGECGCCIQEEVGEYMFCSECGAKLPKDARFCGQCGVSQNE